MRLFSPSRRPRVLAALLGLVCAACNDRTVDASATDSSSGSSGDPSGATAPTTENPCATGCVPDMQPPSCDLFAQDCPPGSKCNSNGDETVCTPQDPAPGAPGDPCTRADPGVDSCAAGGLCWIDDVCHAYCLDPQVPCPKGQACVNADGLATVCVASCNPLAPSCPAGQVCVIPSSGIPVCAPDVSGAGGEAGDVCEFVNACDPGNQCDQTGTVPDCAGKSCCTPFCDFGVPDPGCPPGQKCLSFYAPGSAPAGLEFVGTCGV